nr:MAG TPA: hypothetical protein [Caudoviricetes sp.]
MSKRDFRKIKELEDYIYDPDTTTGDYAFCPNCSVSFNTSNIEVVDMREDDCDYGGLSSLWCFTQVALGSNVLFRTRTLLCRRIREGSVH